MDVPTFSRLFPKVYHLTFESNLPSIQEHGLLSTQALADRYAFDSEERQAVVVARRRCNQTLHGITIRDQGPMHESKMKCLVGITIPEWIALLNSKIFFFVSKEKALSLADRYAAYENSLLEIDTDALLLTHAAHVTLCRINAGAFVHKPVPRGRDSFIPLANYIYKNKRSAPAELTIDAPIPDILQISTFLSLPTRIQSS